MLKHAGRSRQIRRPQLLHIILQILHHGAELRILLPQLLQLLHRYRHLLRVEIHPPINRHYARTVMLAPLREEFLLSLQFFRHPTPVDVINHRGLTGRQLLVSGVHRHRLHVTIFVAHPHDVDIVIDQIIDKKCSNIASAIPWKDLFVQVFLVFPAVRGLPIPFAVPSVVELGNPTLVLARVTDRIVKRSSDFVPGHSLIGTRFD